MSIYIKNSRVASLVYMAMLIFIANSAMVAQPTNAVLKIKVNELGVSMPKNLYGIFFEDINFAGDGGIYAEMVRNRSFDDIVPPLGCKLDGDFAVTPGGFKWFIGVNDSVPSWQLLKDNNSKATMHLDALKKLNAVQYYSLRIDMPEKPAKRVAVANAGYYGMAVSEGQNYNLSFFACAKSAYSSSVVATIEDELGNVYGQSAVKGLNTDWKKYNATIKATKTGNNLRLVISFTDAGTVWLDMVSLFPENTWNKRPNGLRADLMQKLVDLKPGFLRFPGGCVVEGMTFGTAIKWKETVGSLEERKGRVNVWGYRSTDGLGYHEFLLMAEDLKCEPLFVFNVGMTCQARNSYLMPMDSIQPMIQDALDAIEYANGSSTSKWGAMRAKNGHPEPFKLKYVEIGNENWGADYDARYEAFFDVIKAKYPDLITIRSAHPTADKNPLYFPNNKGEMLDLHYYRSPDWLFKNHNILDDYPRVGKKIYIGEFACNEKVERGNLYSALADATFMLAFEHNADIIELASYAPLLENESKDGYKWPVNMIHFDSHQIYTIPTYYVQQMLTENMGDALVKYSLTSDSVKVQNDLKTGAGAIGFDTYSTKVEYDDVRVISGKDTLYKEDFSSAKTKYPLNVTAGIWQIADGVLRQTDATLFAHAFIGDTTWKNYRLEFKARRLSGNEGFFMTLFYKDEQNWLKWNIGGWNNTQHALELRNNGSSTYLGPMVPGKVKDSTWYKVKIETKGNEILCYLNDSVIHHVVIQENETYQRVYANVTKDFKANAIMVKLVNPFNHPASIDINLEGAKVADEAEETVLSSASPNDNNSFEAPNKVAPTKQKVIINSEIKVYTMKAKSLTILKFFIK